MGLCISGASLAPTDTNYYYESPSFSSYTHKRDSGAEMGLHRVPGRIFLNGSSHVASLCCKQGRKGINQDAMLLWENFGTMEDVVFCGVFDGHGPFGHVVAKKVRNSFPLKLMEEWNSCLRDDYENNNYNKNNNNNHFGILRESFLKASKFMDNELRLQYFMESYGSGTTAVTLLKKGDELVTANVGDSRAVLGTLDPNGSLIALQLTTDLKPNLPREAERIRICKGRVFALDNDSAVARLWLPNVDSPGLAMSRAFGDFVLKDSGLISVPEVSYHRITDHDQFVVLATDGVWDVLSNNQVVTIVASAPRSSAAKLVVEAAVQAWKTKVPNSKPDDCSAVCLFFHSNTNTSTPNTKTSIGTWEEGAKELPYKTKQKHL